MPGNLTAPMLAAITLVCAFGCAMAGSFVRDRLPADQLSRESQDVIRLGMGLVATMTALLLGMVTATTRIAYDSQDKEIKTGAVNILTLDRHLARLGDRIGALHAEDEAERRRVAGRAGVVGPPLGHVRAQRRQVGD